MKQSTGSRTLLSSSSGVPNGETAWVIGASSGIGAALARRLHQNGVPIAISGRNEKALNRVVEDCVGPADVHLAPLDATDRDAVQCVADAVNRHFGRIHTVVYMAGKWGQMDVTAWDPESFSEQVAVHLEGLNNVLAATLPMLIAEGAGRIVITSSLAGFRGLPGSESYGATKAAQINLAESLQASLHEHNVDVSVVCPGFVRTPMTAHNEFPMPFLMEPDEAADAIIDGMRHDRFMITFPTPLAAVMSAARVLPNQIWQTLVKKVVSNSASQYPGP